MKNDQNSIIRTCTVEIDPDTSARAVTDINSFDTAVQTPKTRRDLLKYLATQVDMLLDGQAHEIRIEVSAG